VSSTFIIPNSVRQSIIDNAIAAGTHSPAWQTVCSGCGQWVESVYHGDPTNMRKHFCADCADRLFRAGPRSFALHVQKILNSRQAAREQAAQQTWGVHS
jgi:hypothetical protein